MEKTKKKKKNTIGKVVIFLLIIIISIPLIGIRYYKQGLLPMEPNNPKDISLTIPASTSSGKIAEILHENGLVKHPLIFQYEIRSKGVGGKLKAGDYELSTGMDIEEIIDSLTKGGLSQNTTRFTIPEGYEIRQIADRLSREELVNEDRFLELVSNKANFQNKYEFLKLLNDGQNLEGFLFPSTYEIFVGSTEEEIIEKMLDEFEKIYESELKSKIEETGLEFNELITLASIVEREGKVEEELPIMSAVFHNRINQGMMLQSCATVQYILGERKEVLTNEDTRTPSPFNTYINQGLPPSPIASPGRTALMAAVNPADVDYLFFVLTGEDGTHTFTKTYNEHLNAKPKN